MMSSLLVRAMTMNLMGRMMRLCSLVRWPSRLMVNLLFDQVSLWCCLACTRSRSLEHEGWLSVSCISRPAGHPCLECCA